MTVVAAPALRPFGGAHELEGESREERARIAIPAAALANATAAVTRAGRRRGGSRAPRPTIVAAWITSMPISRRWSRPGKSTWIVPVAT